MAVNFNRQSTRPCSFLLGSLALAVLLGSASQASAEVVYASDDEASTTIFIADDSSSEPPRPPQFTAPQSAEGSIVFVDDAPQPTKKPAAQPSQPTVLAPAQHAVRGDLKVVANPTQQANRNALRPLSSQQSLAPPAQHPALPLTTIETVEAVQPVAVPFERELPGEIQVAVHTELQLGQATADAQATAKVDSVEAVSAETLLVKAHQLSLTAETIAEYAHIAESCSQAIDQGLPQDQLGFARNLSSWAINRRGQLRADAGERDLAGADFQTALDFNASNWRALHNRGVSFAQSGSFAEAFDDFNAVIQINPRYAKAYANRATLYVQAKDLQAAIKDYELAIQADPEFATAFVGLGRVCHMLGRWDEAIDHFTTAVHLQPTSPDVICSRGDLHADMGNYGEALADYARTIEINPEFAHAYRNGAWLLATCPDERYRDPANAVLGAKQALEYSYGERHVALDTLAAALAADGQFDEAVTIVTQAVDLAPTNTKFAYLSRLQLYQESQPFRTDPIGNVEQVMYEASDQE